MSAQESAQKENQNLSDAILEAIQASKVQIGEQVAELSASLSSAVLNDQQQSSLTYSHRLQDNVSEFRQRVLNLAESSNARRTTRLMLHSLDFPQRDHRHKNIYKAHEATFNWLFRRDHSQAKPWADYVEWLTAQDGDNGLYWITGKAGSGKSTLMRYLVDDPRTIEFLQQWAASKRVAVASCFFWNPGKEKLQKSVEGLLRTLLRDLLIEMPGIADTLSQWRWQSYELGAAHLPSWTSMELLSAFEAALKGSRELANVCLFIDGLDEFEGDDKARGEIINLLTQASEYPHIKVCISSRPWRIFEDAFDTRPSLKLEDLNLDDIKQYVDKELVNNRAFQRFQQLDPSGCQELAYEVVTKARGVFLWVFLVVRELLIGLQNEDRITDLRRRLHKMPPDLKDYFAHMMHTLEEFYLEQANHLFQVAMQRDPVVSLLTYSFVHEEDPEYAMKLPVQNLVGEALSKRLEFMERRLNTLCKGLLEVHKTSGSFSFCSHSVEFLHRTVGEFLQSDVLEKMLKPDRNPFDVHTAMCKAYLAEIKSYPFQKEDKQPLLNYSEAVMSHARIYELEHQTSLMSILDELDRSLETQFNRYIKFGEHNSYWPNYYSVKNRKGEEIFYLKEWNNSFLTLAFWWGLYIYVKESIIKHPDRVRNKRGRPLPDYFISRTDLSEQEKDQIAELKTLANIALGRRSDSAPPRRIFSIRRLLNKFESVP